MKLWLVLLVLLFSSLPGFAQTVRQSISLQKMSLPANGRPTRMSNLFFAKPDNKQVHYPPDWKQVEISPVMENAALAPVYVIRFQESGGPSYVVDTNADLDFQNESKLRFHEIDELKFADFEVTVQARAPKQGAPTKVSYQIVLSRDGYVYARISEYRVGEIRIAGKTFGLDLHTRSRNYPLFDLSGSTVCLIDLNTMAFFRRVGAFPNPVTFCHAKRSISRLPLFWAERSCESSIWIRPVPTSASSPVRKRSPSL
jgi:hypothetical protein